MQYVDEASQNFIELNFRPKFFLSPFAETKGPGCRDETLHIIKFKPGFPITNVGNDDGEIGGGF